MAAGIYDITVEQGATFELDITWNDSAGTPVVLTGYSARMKARTTYTDTSVLFSLVSGTEIILTTPGNIRVTIAASATATYTPGDYVYDIEMVNGTTVYRLLQGVCTVSPEVTY